LEQCGFGEVQERRQKKGELDDTNWRQEPQGTRQTSGGPALRNAHDCGGEIVRLYDRETDESAKAFDAWTVYRDLGAERSLQKASEMYYGHGANVGQFERWSRRYGWVERARAFDVEREMVRRSAPEVASMWWTRAPGRAHVQTGIAETGPRPASTRLRPSSCGALGGGGRRRAASAATAAGCTWASRW
jgi:hypothetical protein